METFEAKVRPWSFGAAVVLPPVGYWVLVQGLAAAAGDGPMNVVGVALLIALATALPIIALGWVLGSVAAYSVAPGKLVEHRVVRDREYALAGWRERPAVVEECVVVKLQHRTLRLCVANPESLRQKLVEAGG